MSWARWVNGDATNKLMASNGLPRPELLMANMLALKLSKLSSALTASGQGLLTYFEIPLEGGRVVEVRCTLYHGDFAKEIKVGLPGSPHYRNVILNEEEQQIIGQVIGQLWKKTKAQQKLKTEHDSQDASLTILEGLL